MLVESSCTIYLRQADGTYSRQVADCHWEDKRGIQFNVDVVRNVDAVEVIIPLDYAQLPAISEKDKQRAFILRGIYEDELTAESIADFIKANDALSITAVEKNDYSAGLADNHWVVYAK